MIYELQDFWSLVREMEMEFLNSVHEYKIVSEKRDWSNLFFVKFVTLLSRKLETKKNLKVITSYEPKTIHLCVNYSDDFLRDYFRKFIHKMIRILPNMFVEYSGEFDGDYLSEDLDVELVVKIDRKHNCPNCFPRLMEEFKYRFNKLNETIKVQNFH